MLLGRAAKVTATSFTEAAAQTQHALARLTGIEKTVGTDLVKKFEKDSTLRGGEQYLPDKDKIECESERLSSTVCRRSFASAADG